MIAKRSSLSGALALVLASVGRYGVTAYWVERRTGEIGVRMALGADRPSVLRLVLRGAFLEVGIELAIGIPATILAGRAIAAQLFGVTILLGTTAVLCLAALVAALIPTQQAAGVDPLRALRTD
jgi:ABC-type antimicrobial peptide transport system permease subunit